MLDDEGCIILMQKLNIKTIAGGQSFDRSSKLGKGAFGDVYLGFDEERNVPCAFKVINLDKVKSQTNPETLMKKIKDEIVNMQLAKHPSIIQFYQAKQSTNNIYILCEYCNGESLAAFLERRSYLTQWEALELFREILKGFYHLRKSNIVHRDIKPANLLLHNFSIKIGDLGFSKATEHHEQMLQSIVGTPLYMSPQIFERQKYTEKTDIWSLGVILYQMLYGRNPWAGSRTLLDLKERIKREVVFPQYPVVSASLKVTIRRMLVVQEDDRISWEALFSQYLSAPPSPKEELRGEGLSIGLPSEGCLAYFRKSLFLQSRLQLPKVVRELGVLGEEQLAAVLGGYQGKDSFYEEVEFLSNNRTMLEEYYGWYLEKRNQVVMLMVLTQKLLALAQRVHLELSACCYSLSLLCLRYSLTILEELINSEGLVSPGNHFQAVIGRFCSDKLLMLLLKSDHGLIRKEYLNFLPFFHAMMSKIGSHSIAAVIQKDLSGIYGCDQNQKRVIRFFTLNYMRKVFNATKSIVSPPPSSEMVEEEQEGAAGPGLDLVVVRMVGEYLCNSQLFKLGRKGAQNMAQLFFDWETRTEGENYSEVRKKGDIAEESVELFLKKEIWSQMLMSGLSRPPLAPGT